jgi:hypothetical protein
MWQKGLTPNGLPLIIHVAHVRKANRMNIALVTYAKTEVLAGSASGSEILSQLVGQVNRVSTPTVVVLDFDGISVATGSFLRECVLGFRDYCRRSQPNLHPVVANLTDAVAEELKYLLQSKREVLVACTLKPNGRPIQPEVIGTLEEKQKLTLDAVLELEEVDAAVLAERFSSEKIGITGWNNRLASLAAGGILMEVRSGRGKRYRPVVEGLKNGA